MTVFRYRAVQADGRVTTGRLAEDTTELAASRLEREGLAVLEIRERPRRPLGGPVSRHRLGLVFRNLAALTAAGIPLERALASSRAVAEGKLLDLITRGRTRLREGWPLSRALDDGSGAIPSVVLGMLRGGERIGKIPEALEQIADHLEREASLTASVRQALAYPVVLAAVGTVAMAVLLTRVVPRFGLLIADSGTVPPRSTRVLLSVARLLHDHQALLTIIAIGACLAILLASRSTALSGRGTAALTRLPVVGRLHQSLASARVCAVLSGMLQAGGPVLPALIAAGEAAGDQRTRQGLEDAGRRVREGAGLARALREAGAVAEIAVQLIGIGEESGRVPEMARRASDLSALAAKRSLDTIVTMIEPTLILVFGALVAFVAAALLQAVYGLQAGTLR